MCLIKAALVYKRHWGSRKKTVVACSPEFTVSIPREILEEFSLHDAELT